MGVVAPGEKKNSEHCLFHLHRRCK